MSGICLAEEYAQIENFIKHPHLYKQPNSRGGFLYDSYMWDVHRILWRFYSPHRIYISFRRLRLFVNGPEMGMGRTKIPIKSIMYAIDSSGVNIYRTIILTLGNS